jgi:phosphoglucosamine mutase
VAQRPQIETNESIQTAIRDTESELGGRGRVVLRASGTEPVVRVMVEGEDEADVKRLAGQLADSVRQALG